MLEGGDEMTKGRATGDFMEQLGQLRRQLTAVATEVYAGVGMARAQGKFLRHIAQRTRISQAELARATDTDPALTGRTVQAIIDAGLVRRTRSQEDRREYVLELTAAGRRAAARVEKARDELAVRIAGVLDERDREDFERIVRKLVGAFGGAGE